MIGGKVKTELEKLLDELYDFKLIEDSEDMAFYKNFTNKTSIYHSKLSNTFKVDADERTKKNILAIAFNYGIYSAD